MAERRQQQRPEYVLGAARSVPRRAAGRRSAQLRLLPTSRQSDVVELPPDKPIVKLEWGLYAFVPSIKAISELEDLPRVAAERERDWGKVDPKNDKRRKGQLIEYALRGGAVIAKLRRAERLLGFDAARDRWKIALEDISTRMSGVSQDVWAAIREFHGGALRTPYGVLVCSKTLVQEVFDNKRRALHGEWLHRAHAHDLSARSISGKDDGEAYRAEACPANKAIMDVTFEDAFEVAIRADEVRSQNPSRGGAHATKLEVKDIVDKILSALSTHWFGMPDDKDDLVEGGWHWRADVKPTCPGHFHSPSRYMFQPNPGNEASLVGQQHGKALQTAVAGLLASRSHDMGTIGNALLDEFRNDPGHCWRARSWA